MNLRRRGLCLSQAESPVREQFVISVFLFPLRQKTSDHKDDVTQLSLSFLCLSNPLQSTPFQSAIILLSKTQSLHIRR